MAEPSQEYLRANLDYDPSTGVLTWKERKFRHTRKGERAGCINKDGYWQLRLDNETYLAPRIIWTYVNGPIPEALEIDHKNGITADDRIENLRLATNRQQMHNRRRLSSNTSGRTGVCWRKSRRCWVASIRVEGKKVYLGSHQSFEIACQIRDAAEQIYFGEFQRKDKIA